MNPSARGQEPFQTPISHPAMPRYGHESNLFSFRLCFRIWYCDEWCDGAIFRPLNFPVGENWHDHFSKD